MKGKKKKQSKHFNSLCIYNIYQKLYSVLTPINHHFLLRLFHNLCNLSEVHAEIQQEILGAPETHFPHIRNKQVSKSHKTTPTAKPGLMCSGIYTRF